ncbi:MAG: hypothetical protein RL684_997 [Pseudomonadota bacterium]|jgi:hypothetical protein
MAPPEPTGATGSDDVDAGYYQRLDTIASGQRLSIFAILLNIALRGMLTSHAITMHTGYLLAIAIGVLSLVGIVRMCSGLEYRQGRKISCMALSFVPLANIVMLVVLSVQVTRILRQAGWRVGLFGARP